MKLLAWRLDVAHVDPLGHRRLQVRRELEVPRGHAREAERHLRRIATRISPSVRATRCTACCRRSGRASRRRGCRSSTRRSSPAPSAGSSASRARLTSSAAVDDHRRRIRRARPSPPARASGPTCSGRGTRRSRLPAAYTWVMSAGATVRAAVGVLGGTLPALTADRRAREPADARRARGAEGDGVVHAQRRRRP